MEFFNCKVTISNFNDRELHDKCFPINFAKFFRTAALKIICKRLLLKEQLAKPRSESLTLYESLTVNFIKKETPV